MSARKVAIVLCNLGGPDGPDAVRPFLYNLFNDRFIVAAPQPVRAALAWAISMRRAPYARENYAKMGGASPLLPETQRQAEALDRALAGRALGAEAKCFIAMRHWKPFTEDAAKAARAWGAVEALVLPLYPQFSGATTASSLAAWRGVSDLPTRAVCCWPAADRFARAHADVILDAWRKADSPARPRVLFSAHGLPERAVKAGDPYQWQIEKTCAAVTALLPPDWEHEICYQSRVGPLKWIGPSTEEAIDKAGRDRIGVIVSPISFVSEHIETLVELDIDYAARAEANALPFFGRAPALSAREGLIETMADLIEAALKRPLTTTSETGARLCPAHFSLCPMKATS
ncbi:MAG: ferrochelatase [Hyphomonadaceae bacterium]